MRRLTMAAAAVVLLAGPTVLAFRSGGFFDEPRLVAAVVAWLLVLITALTAEKPLPHTRPAQAFVGGLLLLTAWTILSLTWAPLAGPAFDDAQRLLLYLATAIAAVAWLGRPEVRRFVEPALACGGALVTAYGLSERFLPWLVELDRSETAFGRLEQPLTYWNAMGALGAMGFTLCARLAGDRERPPAMRAAAAVACPLLGVGVYLSFSRGALAALAAGVAALALLTPNRAQWRALALAVAGAAIAAATAGALSAVRTLEGSSSRRAGEGAVVLVATLALGAIGAWQALRDGRSAGGEKPIRLPGRRPVMVACAIVVAAAALLAAQLDRRPEPRQAAGATPTRLASIDSNRYSYWEVAFEAFADQPLKGLGAGGFQVEWRRKRSVLDPAEDAHSLYIETAAELGIVGLLLLALMLAGAAWSAAAARAHDPAFAAGPIAALAVFAVHAGLDWHWEMPAVAGVAVVLAAALASRLESPTPLPRAD